MKTAIIHIAGLGTPPESSLCGLRPFWEALAAGLGAIFTALAYNDPAVAGKFVEAAAGADALYVSGHSHGADELYSLLSAGAVKRADVAVFLDDAPLWDPTRWTGSPLPTPAVAENGLWFYQRNDAPLCGVAGQASPTTQVFDVTAWGLHHSSICADERVWDRMKMAVLAAHVARMRTVMMNAEGEMRNAEATEGAA